MLYAVLLVALVLSALIVLHHRRNRALTPVQILQKWVDTRAEHAAEIAFEAAREAHAEFAAYTATGEYVTAYTPETLIETCRELEAGRTDTDRSGSAHYTPARLIREERFVTANTWAHRSATQAPGTVPSMTPEFRNVDDYGMSY